MFAILYSIHMVVHKEPNFWGRIFRYKKLGEDPGKAWEEAQRQALPTDPSIPGATSTPEEAARHFKKTAESKIKLQGGLLARLRRKRLGL